MPKEPADFFKEATELEGKVKATVLPPELKERALSMVKRLTRMAK